MKYWVYKCNGKNMPHQVVNGDWDYVFSSTKATEWGSTEWTPGLAKLQVGDHILAYQTDRNELVGLALVKHFKKRGKHQDVVLQAIREIRVKVRPLKTRDAKIAAIPALQPGPIKTIYEISTADAKRLLAASE